LRLAGALERVPSVGVAIGVQPISVTVVQLSGFFVFAILIRLVLLFFGLLSLMGFGCVGFLSFYVFRPFIFKFSEYF
jgi:hypothetical protein